MSFAVVRHPDIEALGTIPAGALDYHRLRGWYRVSDWRDAPADFHLPDFADSYVDLDAPEPEAEPEPEPKPAPEQKTTPVDEVEER